MQSNFPAYLGNKIAMPASNVNIFQVGNILLMKMEQNLDSPTQSGNIDYPALLILVMHAIVPQAWPKREKDIGIICGRF